MGKEICNLNPTTVWNNFYSLTQIPRPSKHEEEITKFMQGFGTKLGLETIIDEVGNVLIRKPATAGMEDLKTVVLQGHLDMVPQKNSDIAHDFERDAIETIIDNGWVKANQTTLGSDNGIGVAAIMSVLEDNTIVHGPIEALFTIDEETGMTGAFGLKSGFLKADILLNLDSEDEGELYVGCAGGINITATMEAIRESTPDFDVAMKISLKGLKGGHSGLDINMERANANKVMFHFLKMAVSQLDIRISSVAGGNLRNAIPREAFAEVTLPEDLVEEFIESVAQFEADLKDQFKYTEPSLSFTCEKIEVPEMVLNEMVQDDLIHAVIGCFNGVYRLDVGMENMVETSNNLAIVNTNGDEIQLICLARSSSNKVKEELCSTIGSVLTLAGFNVKTSGEYPGWQPNPSSEILATMKNSYLEKFGKLPEVKAIHAGLECGIIGANYPNLDMISFGPTIRYPHSPDEKVNIESVQAFWDWLLATLATIPKK